MRRFNEIQGWVVLTGALWILLGTSGCSFSEDTAASADPLSERQRMMQDAQTALGTHRIDDAETIYDQVLQEYPEFGAAAAGRAVTGALLLPESAPLRTLVQQSLGGDSGIDAVEVLYAEKGYLYWLSRGASWDGGGQFAGIKSLLANRLPWPERRLDSLAAFTADLTESLEGSRQALLALTDELKAIEADVDRALADASFQSLRVPGEVFHDSSLTVVMGRSELALMAGLSAGLRAAIHTLLAYEQDWSLERAFGPHWSDAVEEAQGERANWTAWDFTLDYLDDQLLRARATQAEQRAGEARASLVTALSYLEQMLSLGLSEAGEPGSLAWDQVDPLYVQDWRNFVAALRLALNTKTELPSTDPTVSADFSGWFSGPRVLDERVEWLAWDEVEITVGENGGDGITEIDIAWTFNDEAIQSMFVDGLFDPPFSVPMETEPELSLTGESFTTFRSNLWGDLRMRFEEAYLIRE